jgi:hypothetical protein
LIRYDQPAGRNAGGLFLSGGGLLDLRADRLMYSFNRSQRADVDEGLSNAEVDPVREAGFGGGSLAPGFKYENGPGGMPGPFLHFEDDKS